MHVPDHAENFHRCDDDRKESVLRLHKAEKHFPSENLGYGWGLRVLPVQEPYIRIPAERASDDRGIFLRALRKAYQGDDPATVKTIKAKAFYGNKKLKNVRIYSTVLKTAGSKCFSGISSKAVIKVPAKKVAAYKKLLKVKNVKK